MSNATGSKVFAACKAFIEATAKADEKKASKLAEIAVKIQSLDDEGHAQFRSEIEVERVALAAARANGGIEAAEYNGYLMTSYTVLLANWKAISKACQLGLVVTDDKGKIKAWNSLYKEAVKINQDAQSKAASERVTIGATVMPPVKATSAGRKATTPFDKALAAVTALLQANPSEFRRLTTFMAKECKKMDDDVKASIPTVGAPKPTSV